MEAKRGPPEPDDDHAPTPGRTRGRLTATSARAAPWIAGLLVALPIVAYHYPPMFDLPNHEEIVAAMRHFTDESRYPPGLLRWNLGHPNQLFYFLAWLIALVLPVSAACKLVVAGSVAAIPLAAARLAGHLGATRWGAVTTAPLGLGFAFYFGFAGNLLGYALFLGALPFLDDFARAPTARRAAGAVLVLVVLYEAHESALVAGCLALGVLSAVRPFRRELAAYRVAPLVAAGALAAFEQVRAVRAMGPNLSHLPPIIDLALWQKLDGFPQALLGLHGREATREPFVVLLVSLALFAIDRVRLRPPRAPSALLARFEAHRFEILGATLIVAYFVLPFSIQGAMWLHARFLAPGVAVLAVTLAPRGKSPSVLTRVASFAPAVAMILLTKPEFDATGAIYRDEATLFAAIEPGSALVHVDLVGGPLRNLVFSVAGAVAQAGAERGGRVAVSFLQTSPIPPVIIAPEHRWDGALARTNGDGTGLEPAFDLRLFRYVLAFVPETQMEPLTRALAPEARPLRRAGNWMLFASTLPQISLLDPEPAHEPSASLAARLAATSNGAGAR